MLKPRTKPVILLGLVAITALALAEFFPDSTLAQPAEARSAMPTYNESGGLLLPEGFETWIFLGSSLALSYSEGAAGMEMFHHTFMEPTAYRHFQATGEFREGTMLVLLLHGTGEGVLPARNGRFAAEVHGVEMAVKDSSRAEETWAYYNFGIPSGLQTSAQPLPAASCQSCHVEHAAHDNVFVQFYPLLVDAAPEGALPTSLSGALPARSTAAHAAREGREAEAPLALAGLDPIHLAQGREELGKGEIVEEFGGYRYQFLSEPSRKTFAANPSRYAIQNQTCPVIPGAPIDPALISVYGGKIYAFASPGCVEQFNADPKSFLEES